MVQKLGWILLVSVICLCQNSYGSNYSTKEDYKAFGYELLQIELDDMKNSQNQISKELTQVKDSTMEASKIIIEKQNALMEKLLGGILTIANNANQNKITADKQTKLMEQLTNELAQMKDIVKMSIEKQSSSVDRLSSNLQALTNKMNHNKIADGLTQLRDANCQTSKLIVDKQSLMMEQLLDGIFMIANNASHEAKILKHPIESCESAERSGLHKLSLKTSQSTFTVHCEMDKFDGGWLVIQQRLDGSVDFAQNWTTYKHGFGTVSKTTEFWLGLELIHQITNSGDYELAIELKDENGKYGYARYSDFKIAGEGEKYRLSHLGGYSGTIGDQLSYHKDMKFTTFDQDNDERSIANCSYIWYSNGGWWYKDCAHGALNGAYTRNRTGYGIRWDVFSDAATFSRMMIRRK